MPRLGAFRPAFTLIEVMVAVMIVSVVIAALLQMQGNASHKFLQLKEMISTSQYSSFLLSSADKYGFERSSTDMKTLLDDFELESDLRQKLSAIKVKIDYEELEIIDTNKFLQINEHNQEDDMKRYENMPEQTMAAGVIFEIGQTRLETQNSTNKLLRVRLQ